MELSFIQENVKMTSYKHLPNSKQGNSFTKQVDSIQLKAFSWTTVALNETSQGNLCIQKTYFYIRKLFTHCNNSTASTFKSSNTETVTGNLGKIIF